MNVLVLLSAIFIFLTSSSHAQNSLTCSPSDLNALKDFNQHLDSKMSGWDFTNSSSINCCSWTGITCASSSSLGLNDSSSDSDSYGRVVKLELPRTRIFGNISDSLGDLDQLRTLNLTRNFLKGSFPRSLLHLPMLEILDLSNNEISGWFPSSINLPSIRILNISENSITGSVPVWICENSSKIEVLSIADNFFSGYLSRGLAKCTVLEEMDLSTNFITGDFPDDLFDLSSLRKLNLQENRFSGRVSNLLGKLENLDYIDLSMNGLSGNIPDVFDRFKALRYFSAQSNNFTGEMPTSLSNSRTITTLSLRNNSLSGAIVINCSAMTSLVSLNLATNKFHGKIPENLPLCPNLKTINFARINFSGQVPESFKNFKSLSYISLSNSSISNISSALETLQNCKNLTTLVLTLNFHDEPLPNISDNNYQFPELKTLVIANCRLTGFIPQWLSNCKKLQLLDLSWNRLEGSIPPWFGDFQSLFYLDLSNNSLTGEIPKELTGLRSLAYGNISVEEPTPDFPFFVRRNLSGFRYKQVESFPPTIELGNNYLTGQIWPEFGNLKELHVLDLKSNNLTGPIPSELSGMRSLETLDLSFNDLSGTIPPSLTKLTFLSKFSVANNSLHGPIPSGPQFSSFPNSSFEGNSGLCGEHGPRPCDGEAGSPRLQENESRSKGSRNAAIAMGVGFSIASVVILIVILLLFLCSRPRKVIDPETDVIIGKNADFDDVSNLVILCQNADCNKEIFLDDLLIATNDFDQSHIIGCGGFGLVYLANLSNGTKLAIKRLSGEFLQIEREFRAEIETLTRAQHPNLVQLQGYCNYKEHRLLIYSYMENGSLDYWLHEKTDGPASLNWRARLGIARGALAGLHYLHHSCEPRILHRDIKSSNILLDENFEARLADFGLARLILPYDTHVTTDLVGTLGYIPPEYGQASVATYKGDVYSFGVVLLELLTGKRPVDMCRAKDSRELVPWVSRMRREEREREVFDPFVYDKEHDGEMVKVLEIACLCLSENPKARPATQELVSLLDGVGSE